MTRHTTLRSRSCSEEAPCRLEKYRTIPDPPRSLLTDTFMELPRSYYDIFRNRRGEKAPSEVRPLRNTGCSQMEACSSRPAPHRRSGTSSGSSGPYWRARLTRSSSWRSLLLTPSSSTSETSSQPLSRELQGWEGWRRVRRGGTRCCAGMEDRVSRGPTRLPLSSLLCLNY